MMMELINMAAAAGGAASEAVEIAKFTGFNGSATLAIAGAAAAIGIGMIGGKAVEAVGRNPGAFGNILTLGIIAMALAEAIAIYALIIAFGGR